jgi:DNA-binding CsgD family transcriptional regulator
MLNRALTQIIGAIGNADFAAAATGELRHAIGFDLAAAVLHRHDAEARLLFDDFEPAGHAQGIRNYVRLTHRMNPMLAPAPACRAVRASDFVLRRCRPFAGADRYLVWTQEEEMGFRTLGWPERCEEIGVYFAAWDGIVELSFYRARGREALSDAELRALDALAAPVAAAFERHAALTPAAATTRLSARECEVYDLLIAGCSSEAIALRLGISRHTVKDHRKQIFRKMRIGSLAELFASARRPN